MVWVDNRNEITGPMTDAPPAPRLQNRSGEELAMRAIVEAELRRLYPSARIIHEFPLRYSERRIDLAAVTSTKIITAEIKSSRDVVTRLERQIRGFAPISTTLVVALAPVWNVELPMQEVQRKKSIRYHRPLTEAQHIIDSVGDRNIETWTVPTDPESPIEITKKSYWENQNPWPQRLLEVLHVSELLRIIQRHAPAGLSLTRHDRLVWWCCESMTGRDITRAVCAALRERDAFAKDSDPPIRSELEPIYGVNQDARLQGALL